jgi:SAM-dependent methyltransferase
MRQGPEGPDYILDRSQAESARLILQDSLLRPQTLSLFERAGIGPGMRVLDLGSGVGAVARLIRQFVGPEGSVVGVEIDPATVETAIERSRQADIDNVEFILGDVATVDLGEPFDAVVGRLVLMHLPDPVAVLSRAGAHLRPGGRIAFLEGNTASPWLARPASATLAELQLVRERAVDRVSANLHMGLELRAAFLQAGFPEPYLSVDAVIGGGPGWPGFDYIEQTARSLVGTWIRVGVPGAEDLRLDGLSTRIAREIGATGTVIMHPLVGAWTRLAE